MKRFQQKQHEKSNLWLHFWEFMRKMDLFGAEYPTYLQNDAKETQKGNDRRILIVDLSRPRGRGCVLIHIQVKHVPTHSIFLRVRGATLTSSPTPR